MARRVQPPGEDADAAPGTEPRPGRGDALQLAVRPIDLDRREHADHQAASLLERPHGPPEREGSAVMASPLGRRRSADLGASQGGLGSGPQDAIKIRRWFPPKDPIATAVAMRCILWGDFFIERQG